MEQATVVWGSCGQHPPQERFREQAVGSENAIFDSGIGGMGGACAAGGQLGNAGQDGAGAWRSYEFSNSRVLAISLSKSSPRTALHYGDRASRSPETPNEGEERRVHEAHCFVSVAPQTRKC